MASDDFVDLATPIGRGFIAFLSALAEDERQRIVKCANDGRAGVGSAGWCNRVARERFAKG